jgi:hypothetical protein
MHFPFILRTACTPSSSWTIPAIAAIPSIPNEYLEVLDAEKLFRELSKAGYTAAKRAGNGTAEVIRQFDPTVKETLFSSSADDDWSSGRCRPEPCSPSGSS